MSTRDTVAFTPYATMKDMFAALGVPDRLRLVRLLHSQLSAAMRTIRSSANPLVTPAHIVPEWYLLPFYAILRAIPNKLIGVIALFAAIAVLAFLPWLDTSPVKSAKYRPMYRFFFWMFVAICVGLG